MRSSKEEDTHLSGLSKDGLLRIPVPYILVNVDKHVTFVHSLLASVCFGLTVLTNG